MSDLRITPGGKYDAEFRIDYDPQRMRITTCETLVKMHPYGTSRSASRTIRLTPRKYCNRCRTRFACCFGYGEMNKQGMERLGRVQLRLAAGRCAKTNSRKAGYNGSCCGFAFGYQRLALGTIRDENQFRFSLIIANIGTFGNLRRQGPVF